jgi:hypothetical protein
MRRIALLASVALAALPTVARASATNPLTVVLASATVRPGGVESISITAHDLNGEPLVGAHATGILTLPGNASSVTVHFPVTSTNGQTTARMLVPRGTHIGTASLHVTVTSGFLRERGSRTLRVASVASAPLHKSATPTATAHVVAPRPTATARPTARPTPHRTATSRPTATPHATAHATAKVPSGTATPGTRNLAVSTDILPDVVTAPQPVWLVVAVNSLGSAKSGAAVTAVVHFAEGTVTAHGTADSSGSVTLRIDTGMARRNEHVSVAVSVTDDGASTSTSTSFAVDTQAPVTPTDTATPTPTVTLTPLPTDTPWPTATDTWTPEPVGTAAPTDTPELVGTAVPTNTPLPTDTPLPTATPTPFWTPLPAATDVPTETPTPFWTPSPTPTSTSAPQCPGSQDGCIQAALDMINATRSQYGLSPYSLNLTQSNGVSGRCVGSVGHSIAMANSGAIWHVAPGDDPSAPQNPASFWNDVCVSASYKGENVGQMGSGNELSDIQWIHNTMMAEQHDTAYCQVYDNHACNILSSTFHQVGIGLYYVNGTTWFTTDFMS